MKVKCDHRSKFSKKKPEKKNHTKIEKCLLLFTANTNILIVLYRELKTDGKSFIFAVCRLPFAVCRKRQT